MIAPIRRFQIVRHQLRADAYRQYCIKIEKAVRLVRTGTSVRAALRSVGLKRFADWEEVARICDQRGIPRRRGWGVPLAIWKTQTPNPAHVSPGRKKICLDAKGADAMAKNVLVVRDQIVGSLHHAISSGAHGLGSVPGLLRRAIMEEVWKERTVRQTGETIAAFKSFRAFVETVPPDGLGTNLDLIEKIIRDDPEALEMFRAVTTGNAGRPPKTISDNVTIKSERGNARPYLLSRLKRSRPDLFDKVVAGEMSANAAAIAAGFKKKLTPFDQILKLLPKLTPQQRRRLIEMAQALGDAVTQD